MTVSERYWDRMVIFFLNRSASINCVNDSGYLQEIESRRVKEDYFVLGWLMRAVCESQQERLCCGGYGWRVVELFKSIHFPALCEL